MYLRCAVQQPPKQWRKWLSLAELWYNSSYHFAIDCSPFKALYGYEPNLGVVSVSSDSATPDITMSEMIQDRAMHALMLKKQLVVAQSGMKLQEQTKSGQNFPVGGTCPAEVTTLCPNIGGQSSFPKTSFQILWSLYCAREIWDDSLQTGSAG